MTKKSIYVLVFAVVMRIGAVHAQSPTSSPSPSPQANRIDDKVDTLDRELKLTSGQRAKMRTVFEDQHAKAMAIVNDAKSTRDEKIQKIHELREATIKAVRALLVGDEQQKKFDELVAREKKYPR